MTLITAAGLADALSRESGRPVVLDVRWSLAEPDGRDAYLAGHLPGAVYVSLEDELSSHGAPSDGRHPLPSRSTLEAAARRWGMSDGATVVVYDAATSLAAARAWWLLRHAGVDVRILDGGLAAWAAAGGALEAGEVVPTPGTVTLDWGRMPVIDIDQAAAFPSGGVLLDARAGERFRGEVEPMDPQAGHIPGAVNVPMSAYLHADGTFRARDEIAALFAGAGVGAAGRDGAAPVASYCGSGVTAAHQIAALETIGVTAALYPGSWSEWSNTPGREVATGA